MRTAAPALAAALVSASLTAAPASAEILAEPAHSARPIETAKWQNEIARRLPGIQRFAGLPKMRFGFVVDASGAVRSCLALPLPGREQARGQRMCELFVEHARFEPARDNEGRAVDSVFIADFGATRPVVAAHYAGVPIH